MKILVAIDSFKDCLSSVSVAEHLSAGIKNIIENSQIEIFAMADGGEGTVDAFILNSKGKKIKTPSFDPLNRPIISFYGILGDNKTAVIEMAATSGLELLSNNERNPWTTSTYGTGLLIKDAIEKSCNKIILGIGGSATNDCGAGMACALGVNFFDSKGNLVNPTGGNLKEIENIDISNINPLLNDVEIIAACDVSNPLYGENGAAYVYAKQKGANDDMIKKLDSNVMHFASLLKNQLGKDVAQIDGAGAAGGLGAGIIAFLNGSLQSGFSLLSETIGLENKITEYDLIITGEGKIDGQTKNGKVPYSMGLLAKKYNIPIIAIGGTVEQSSEVLYDLGIDVILPIIEKPCDLEYALKNANKLIYNTGLRIGRFIKILRY